MKILIFLAALFFSNSLHSQVFKNTVILKDSIKRKRYPLGSPTDTIPKKVFKDEKEWQIWLNSKNARTGVLDTFIIDGVKYTLWVVQ